MLQEIVSAPTSHIYFGIIVDGRNYTIGSVLQSSHTLLRDSDDVACGFDTSTKFKSVFLYRIQKADKVTLLLF